MPVRPRRERRPRLALTIDRHLFLTIGGVRREADAVLAAVWREHRERLWLDWSAGSAPEGFWRYEAGVPAELRAGPSTLVPVERADKAARERECLQRRRTAWLTNRNEPGSRPHTLG